MTITQIEKGEINMCFESFDLIELSKEIIDQLEKNAYQKQVKLKMLNSKDEPIYVIGDYQRIYQVIQNLNDPLTRGAAMSGTCSFSFHVKSITFSIDSPLFLESYLSSFLPSKISFKTFAITATPKNSAQ